MFIRELKANFKNFCLWAVITMIVYLLIFLVYPSIIDDMDVNSLNDMIKMFPEDLLKAFNMDISSLESAYGWLKSEGFVFILLIVGCYAGILGSTILLKEESDKSIEYLGTLPIKRKSIVLSKSIVGLIYIISLTLVIGIFNYIGLCLSGDFDKKQYVLLSFTPIFSSVVIFFICMFLSTFFNKTKKMLGISLGIVLFSYILNTLASLSTNTEFLKYFSAFTLSDIRNVILNKTYNMNLLAGCFTISIVFLIFTIIRYDKKEFV